MANNWGSCATYGSLRRSDSYDNGFFSVCRGFHARASHQTPTINQALTAMQVLFLSLHTA